MKSGLFEGIGFVDVFFCNLNFSVWDSLILGRLTDLLISTLAENIEFLRKLDDLTQKELGTELGMTRAAIDSYEGGRAIPPYSKLKIIAEYFGRKVEELTEKKLWLQSTDQQEIWKDRSEEETFEQPISEMVVSSLGKIPILSGKQFEQFSSPDFDVSSEAKDFLSIPVNRQFAGELVAFEATKDFPIAGSLLVAEKLPNIQEVVDSDCYLLVTKGGLIYRRVYNQLRTRGVLVLTPEVADLATIDLPTLEIHSVWKPQAVISYQAPEMKPDPSEAKRLVNQLKAEIDRLG
ncbi:helix-turn-helix domain-containing protein [Jiulongibacter sediminis]|uniref:HTH cro/C1-type domain-containing protein n=1 Tax=Jiulongibacter sediminis TaxID=1605367 RepID=A0A0P7BQ26_9BACT|nr:helix-turn-helix transcriptional regulator [Jiulongibacter sediminis]KPM49239.1 hypothetical protein AFM12_00995 [Jiulongibacter sediminis]TBX26293.1 hypothetical protein TK44_00995 [Jiulongibacter sediminis]